ncbi:hypothetical protein [Manganibacter manganicus]|uniref:Uncharacterized protein n=1 Tax=Manganibacter manganicus TaxID=1873176 RepID=A0A1V8RP25_9HYPH|nr:hypothetical protein [Pseudaminobacter manganicus]OQM74936.1 hypothetical protein BFN67_04795 [Pseudaminobacter manganicus]
MKMLIAFTLSAAAGFGLSYALANIVAPEQFGIIATGSMGDSYIAGVGDDCGAAWDSAKLPADWRSIVCVSL